MKKTFNKLGKNELTNDLEITPKNKKYIEKMLKHLENYVVPKRLTKYRHALTRFAYLVEKDFDKLTKEEVRTAGGIINSGNLSTKTKIDIIANIKTAFKFWFGNDEDFPDTVKGLKRLQQKESINLPEKMLSEKDTYGIIKACPNNRDKFLIALIGLDAALRPVEAFRLKWKQIKKDNHSHFITIETAKKSGDKDTRVVRIIKSEPYFMKWCNEYPKEKTPEDYVFINYQNHNPMNNGTFSALFRRLSKSKKLKNSGRLFPYLLRHSLLTRMSKDPRVSVSVLKKFAGHSLKSNTIGVYQHHGDDDIKEMQLEYNGITKTKAKKEEERKPIKCPKCQTANEYDAEFCAFCNMALSQKRLVQINELMEQNNKLIFEEVNKLIKERMG